MLLLVGGDVAGVEVVSKLNSYRFEFSGQVRVRDGNLHETCRELRSVHLVQFLQHDLDFLSIGGVLSDENKALISVVFSSLSSKKEQEPLDLYLGILYVVRGLFVVERIGAGHCELSVEGDDLKVGGSFNGILLYRSIGSKQSRQCGEGKRNSIIEVTYRRRCSVVGTANAL